MQGLLFYRTASTAHTAETSNASAGLYQRRRVAPPHHPDGKFPMVTTCMAAAPEIPPISQPLGRTRSGSGLLPAAPQVPKGLSQSQSSERFKTHSSSSVAALQNNYYADVGRDYIQVVFKNKLRGHFFGADAKVAQRRTSAHAEVAGNRKDVLAIRTGRSPRQKEPRRPHTVRRMVLRNTGWMGEEPNYRRRRRRVGDVVREVPGAIE